MATTEPIAKCKLIKIMVCGSGGGGGIVVSILVFYSDDPSLNPAG